MHAVLRFAGTFAVAFLRTMARFSRAVPLLLISLATALSACSSAEPDFQDDQLLSSTPSPFSHGFNYASTDACEASRRALLSQGYMTTMTRNDTVDATKNFQPTVDQHIVVEVHVVCTPTDATNTSMVYVNAVQNGYTLKKSATSASVGLSILGSVSLPIFSNTDEMVRISSETIQSDAFYTRFFGLVGRYLDTVARSDPVPGGGDIKSTPLPPLEPVEAANPVMPGVSAAAVSVTAVFPASPVSRAKLLTPVISAAVSAPASAAAASPASTPATAANAASPTVVGANHAAQPGAGSATQAAALPATASAAAMAAAPANAAH